MSDAPHPPTTSRSVRLGPWLQRSSWLAGCLAVAVGCLVLAGWALDIPLLKQVLPGLATMKANTALALALAGLALALWHRGPARPARWAARACAAAGLLLAALTLSQYIGGWDLGIDQLLFTDTASARFPGRMSIVTAVSLALLNMALLLLDRAGAYPLAATLAATALVIAWTALTGYLYNVASLYEVFPYSSVALHTSAALAALAAGILLARAERNPLALIASDTAAGLTVRRLLPAAVLIPLLVGWLRWQGQVAGLYDTAFGLVLMVVALTIVFTALIWWCARALDQLDRDRARMAEALVSSEERFRATFELAAVGLARVGPAGQWLEVNQKLCDIVGYSRAELLELRFQDITHPDDLATHLECIGQLLAGERATYNLENRYMRKDGAPVWASLTVALVRDVDHAPRYFIAVIEDITDRKRDQALLRQILDTNPNIIFVKDRDSTILLANQALARSYGLPLADLVGREQAALQRELGMDQAELQRWLSLDRAVLDAGAPISAIEPFTHRDGTQHWNDTRKFPIELANRQIGVLTISEDITARRQAERDLRESEEKYRTLLEAVADGVFVAQDHQFAFANRALPAMLGYDQAEFIGLPFERVIAPEFLPIWSERFAQRLAGYAVMSHYELCFLRADGAPLWVELRASRVQYRGQPGVLGIVRDVSARKQADQALRASEDRYRGIVETANEGVWVIDAESRTTFVNAKMADILGYTADEMLGQPLLSFMTEDDYAAASTNVDRRRQGIAENHDFRFRSKGGADVWALVATSPLFDDRGGYSGALAMITDITDRKQVEQQLQQSEERFSKAFHSSAVALVISTLADGRILDVNQSFLQLFRCERAGVIGSSSILLGMWVNPDDRGRAIQRLYQDGALRDYEVPIRSSDGATHEVLLSVDVLALDGERCLLTTLYDITDRKRAEQALEAERRRLRTLIDSLPDLIFLKDTGGRFIVANQAVAHFMGVDAPDQLLGKTDFDFYPRELAAEYHAQEQRIIATGEGLTGWEKAQLDLRGEQHWLSTIKLALRDQAGQTIGLVGIEREITARKQAEDAVRQLNAELELRVAERTAQLEAANHELEAFSYTVSHDLRAPLRAISGFARILTEEHLPDLGPEMQEYLQIISDNAQHMDRLITDLLAFARLSRQPLKKRPVAPAELVEQTLRDLSGEWAGRSVAIEVGDLSACSADPALLRQVYVNLIANAIKFTGKRAEAQITIGALPPGDTRGATVYFVRDNGTGFDMRYAGKLFGVFQRLHRAEDYEGTGVGLALVQRIVHRHGGRVWAEAAVDQGATFFFTLEASGSQ